MPLTLRSSGQDFAAPREGARTAQVLVVLVNATLYKQVVMDWDLKMHREVPEPRDPWR